MTDNANPLGRVFKFAEAAKHLGVTRRSLQEIVKKHPHYALNGTRKLFSESDVLLIWEGMRSESRIRLQKIKSEMPHVPPSQYALEERLRKLTARPRRKRLGDKK